MENVGDSPPTGGVMITDQSLIDTYGPRAIQSSKHPQMKGSLEVIQLLMTVICFSILVCTKSFLTIPNGIEMLIRMTEEKSKLHSSFLNRIDIIL